MVGFFNGYNGRSKMLNSSKTSLKVMMESIWIRRIWGWVVFVPNLATHTQIYASKNLDVFFRELGLLSRMAKDWYIPKYPKTPQSNAYFENPKTPLRFSGSQTPLHWRVQPGILRDRHLELEKIHWMDEFPERYPENPGKTDPSMGRCMVYLPIEIYHKNQLKWIHGTGIYIYLHEWLIFNAKCR